LRRLSCNDRIIESRHCRQGRSFVRSTAVTIRGPLGPGYDAVLTPDALSFVADLARRFEPRRAELLARRQEVQRRLDTGAMPDFLSETADVRSGGWRVAPVPEALSDRRVEITGPVDRKMIINALNSGAQMFMADFEDATSPTWANVVSGQVNLRDAVEGTISYTAPDGRVYRLGERRATLLVRPRGWHLPERHVLVDGAPVSASLFDFGLFFFHNARELAARGDGPFFYLPKLESHLEARLWNDVFVAAQEAVNLPRGTIKATVLIETIVAAFEMDEILYELRDHSAGLNCGRWDYIFSVIKKFRTRPEFLLPDRALVTMDRGFLRAYTQLVVKTCHRRGAHAIGGMAAQLPIKGDEAANARALEKVSADKMREARDGHDGTWVAHPALVAPVQAIFDAVMRGPNQLDRQRDDVHVVAADLLCMPAGPVTRPGLRLNVEVGITYLEAWLGAAGAVPIHHLMEDAATAEISRSQVWQWIRHGAVLEDGTPVTAALYREVRDEALAALRATLGEERWLGGHHERAAGILDRLITSPELEDFLTLPAYEVLLELEGANCAN
jgi:malate synthase